MISKYYFLVFCLSFNYLLSAQHRDAFQSDSIYKANKIKRCKVSGSNGFHHSTTYFDPGGRIVRLVKSDNEDLLQFEKYYTEINTYYHYSNNGKLIDMIDSVKTRMPTDEENEAMKKVGPVATNFLNKLSEFPALEVHTYELIYENDEMVLTHKYGPKASLSFVDSISRGGNLHKKYSYVDQFLDQVEFTSYTPEGYPRTQVIQVTDGAYWYESKYDYSYEFEGGLLIIVTGTRHDGQTAETKYFYDENGLVTKRLTGFFGTDQYSEELFTYEYYE